MGNFIFSAVHFNNKFEEILDYHAPIKQKKYRGNTKPHVNKILRKKIMKLFQQKNKINKTGSKDLQLYKFNVVTNLNKSLKKVILNKDFWEQKC